jgi:predicted TIM-barrel fold metal-dependent hydrolase
MPPLRRSPALVLFFVSSATSCAAAHYRGPIIDVHFHQDPPDLPDSCGAGRVADVPTALALLEELPDGSRLGLVTIAPRGDLARTRAQNDALVNAAREHPEQLFAIGSVNPWDADAALAEVDRLADEGVHVLKLHPNTQKFDVGGPEVRRVVERATAHGMVLLFDGYSPFDADETGKFLMLAVEQPDARLILAHMGGPRFADMMLFATVREFAWYPRNVWFDLSAVAGMFARSPFQEELVFVCRSVGLDRVLFGSDYPVALPAEALEDVRALGFTPAEEKQILHDTAAALLAGEPPQ